MKQDYIDTVRLLIDISPTIFRSPRFAMKGGTALNLFIHDMPRLSVDIDVVFTDHAPSRDDALAQIQGDLRAAGQSLEARGYDIVLPRNPQGEEVKLFVRSDNAEVKIEVNHIFRGTLMAPRPMALSLAAQELFTSGLVVPLLDPAEIYGGKLVAAMDRQHPRDLFDVHTMYEGFGLDAAFVDCFVAYLAGHNRPVHEVLFGPDKRLDHLFDNHFRGMTAAGVSLDTLSATRLRLKTELPKALTDQHKTFLLSLVKAEPEWSLMPFSHLHALPALQWKLVNLEKLKSRNRKSFEHQYAALAERLDQ